MFFSFASSLKKIRYNKVDKSIRPSDSFPVLDRKQLESLGIWRHGMMKLGLMMD